MSFQYLNSFLAANQILILRNEIDIVNHEINMFYLEVYSSRNIKRFIKINGLIDCDPDCLLDIDLIILPCTYCLHETHNHHYEKYFKNILDRILTHDWHDEIYLTYFRGKSYREFMHWLNTYASIIFQRLHALSFFPI